jgi:hypothetical protein
MSTLAKELEEMRMRMNDLAKNEQGLITALGDALSRADHKLLDDVRNISAEHDARRGAILGELQKLASRLGSLPKGTEVFAPLGSTARELPSLEGPHGLAGPPISGRADWLRPSTATLQDELSKHLGRNSGH